MTNDYVDNDNLTNKDVLCGRGSGISKTEGNIAFRRVIDQYRAQYLQCMRKKKVNIAQGIVDLIQSSGGRFLRQESSNKKWIEIPMDRRIEKVCQALREQVTKPERLVPPEPTRSSSSSSSGKARSKNKSKTKQTTKLITTNASPKKKDRVTKTKLKVSSASLSLLSLKAAKHDSVKTKRRSNNDTTMKSKKKKPKKVSLSPPSTSSSMKLQQELSSNNYDKSATALHDLDELQQLTKSKKSSTTKHSNRKHNTKKKHKKFMEAPKKPQWSFVTHSITQSWDEMYNLLHKFHQTFGHAAVPPNWAGNVKLAQWATQQRQLYREIEYKYKTPTELEQERISKLKDLQFPMDYEEFHWQEHIQSLKNILINKEEPSDSSFQLELPPYLDQWTRHQAMLYSMDHHENEASCTGGKSPILDARYQALKEININNEYHQSSGCVVDDSHILV